MVVQYNYLVYLSMSNRLPIVLYYAITIPPGQLPAKADGERVVHNPLRDQARKVLKEPD